MKIRTKSSRKSGTTITFTAERKKDSDTLLKLIHEMAKPTPPPTATTPAQEKPPSTENPE